ncbi:MAG: diacylglycerol kinase family protein [Tepidisphaeraceae bacterium]
MKAIVLLNSDAGTLTATRAVAAQLRIERGFAAAGGMVFVRFVKGDELERAAKEATRSGEVEVVIAGGGDGTINTIAGIVSAGDKAFGVLPLGTHNHFAKDLNIPLDLDAAVAALARGRIIELPVGEVNGHLFLNFSAIGLHPAVIRDRENQRDETGRGKWPAMLLAIARKIRDLPSQKVTLSARGHTVARRTPSVIVCNNPHQMKVFGVTNASVPERGLLNVYVATRSKRRAVVSLMLRAAAGALRRETSNFEAMALPELRIDTRRHHLPVSIDGEVMDMRTPLRYRIRARPMRVLVPALSATEANA